MTQSSVNLILRTDTTTFSELIHQAEQEFSSCFKRMGGTSRTQSNRIKDDFNSIGLSAQRFANNLKQAAKQLTLISDAVVRIELLDKCMLDVADRTANVSDKIGISTHGGFILGPGTSSMSDSILAVCIES
ncbi:MAG: hypothetical protein BGO43_15245 [Gammaproteobacteria bacterium 39-13]|mgnify:CR=1 FL=1|nr:hypothetical protein [Gammaproteobacteria bacterium]OJV87773.1 MAG: hypothetical protein BGO43_15245 [Gammaproteobacteria bacterium 39-13]